MFKETKLIFWYKSLESGHENEAQKSAGMLDEGRAKDIKETQNIMGKQNDLRNRIASSDLLTENDKQAWDRKLRNAQSNLSASEIRKLQEEFNRDQGIIKSMVNTYTKKLLDNEEAAFARDDKRGIRTIKDYEKWFIKEQSFVDGNKEKAIRALDPDIKDRIAKRESLIRKGLDKKEVVKMRRSEMQDKLKELEVVEANSARYKSMLQKDAKLFHDINLYIEAFEDLTPQEQKDWMRRYEDEIAKPRRELVKTHEGLPKKFQSSNFLKMPSRKKQEYLDTTETKIEKEYTSQINKIPTEIWSDESKKFAIDDFMRLDSVSKKAQWLKFLPSAIKEEEKLAKEYKSPKFKEIKQMPDYSKKKWERSEFEDKEKMLKSMEAEIILLDTFTSIMTKSVDDKVISKKTKDRYMNMYDNGNLNSRRMAVRSIMAALAPRRALLKDFEKLNSETQKQFSDFYNRGHKARLEIYKKAKTHETENNIEKTAEQKTEEPESLEQNDVKQIVEKLQKQAAASEQLGNLEKALGLHEAVLAIYPENKHSKNKIDQLSMELNAIETASDETVLEAVDNQLRSASAQEELKHIKLAQQILEDKEEVVTRAHGNEDLAKQNAHLGESTFDRAVHEELVRQTGGEKVIDRQGRVKKVQKIDLGKLGTQSGDTIQIEKDLKNLSDRDNLENIQLVDNDAGKVSTIKEAKHRLQKREKGLAKKVSDDETFSLDERLAT
ncbi:hypothetical protein J7J83_04330 [bacterium]|nr:hypothetical protein [bacterium]